MNKLNNPYLIDTNDLSIDEIKSIFAKAKYFKDNYKSKKTFDDLKGVDLCLAFFENSTRTLLSFEMAAKRLGANTIVFSSYSSSLSKGESILDSILTFEAMEFDIFVIRISEAGAHRRLVENTNSIILNAGDGHNQHPSQALLDAFTLQEKYDDLSGKKLTIVGDIKHSRVARSNINILQKLGADISISCPDQLLPDDFDTWGVGRYNNIDEAIDDDNDIMLLRVQKERLDKDLQLELNLNFQDYRSQYAITSETIAKHKDFYFLHPGPVNYGFELDQDLLHHKNCLIQTQVTNGVYIRMAILSLLRVYVK